MRGQSPWADAAGVIGGDVSVIFDVGANVGQTALELSRCFPDATICAFEPVPSTFALLEANTAGLSKVIRLPYGLGANASTHRIFVQPDSGWNSVRKNVDRGLGAVDITLTTVDDFCVARGLHRISILKTDTEGHDLAVLEGARALLAAGRVDAVYAEVGFRSEDSGHTYFCAVLEFLQRLDFQFFGLYGIDGIKYIPHRIEPCYPWSNALFVRTALVEGRFGPAYSRWLAEVGNHSF